jgi:hypothetical protein
MTRRTVLSLIAVVCGLGAVVGAGLRLTADTDTEVGGNVLVQSSSPIVAINTPTIRRNPTDAGNVVVTYRVNYNYFSAFLEWSADGGETFAQTVLPVPSGTPPCMATDAGRPCPFAADIAFDNRGTLYAVYVNLEGNGNVPANLWLSKSTDGGRTLEPPVRVAGRLTFQPRIAVAPDGTVHLTWLQADEVGTLRLSGSPAPIVTVRSSDGGQTFTDPMVISDTNRERVGVATPIVAADGAITVLYQDFKGDRRDFENLEGPVYEDPFGLVVTRSTDGGQTWSRGVEIESGVVPTKRFLVFLPEFPGIAAGPGQTLYATWADGRNGDEDVFLKRSDDGGQTWTPAFRVNDNPVRDGTQQTLPAIAANRSGDVFVLYYGRQNDRTNTLAEVFLARSTDRGRTWDTMRVSSAPVDPRIGPPPVDPKLGIDFGSRLGLDVIGNRVYTAWADTRESNEAFGAQDIGVAVVRIGSAPPLLGRVPVVIALFVIGCAALVGARVASRAPAAAAPPPSGSRPGPGPGAGPASEAAPTTSTRAGSGGRRAGRPRPPRGENQGG